MNKMIHKKRIPVIYSFQKKLIVRLIRCYTIFILICNYSIYWFSDKHRDYIELRKMGYGNIRPFMISKWRFGNNKEHFKRRYYLGEKNDKILFIKIASFVDGTLTNEIQVYKYLSKHSSDSWFTMNYCANDFRDKYNLLVIEYVDELKSLKECDNVEALLEKLNNILDELYCNKIIHADISMGNIKINSENSLVLFDFGITCIDKKPAKVNYNVHCGTHYRTMNGVNIYDDAYSVLCILDSMNVNKNLDGYIAVKNKVGRYDIWIRS